jgi:hypothetical protein
MSEKRLLIMNAHNNYINNLLFDENGNYYTSSWDGTMIKWDCLNNNLVYKIKVTDRIISKFSLIKNNNIGIFSIQNGNNIIVIDLFRNVVIKQIDFPSRILDFDVDVKKSKIIVALKNGMIKSISLDSSYLVNEIQLNVNLNNCGHINDSKDIIVTCNEGSFYLLNSETLIPKYESIRRNLIQRSIEIDKNGILRTSNSEGYNFLDLSNGILFNTKASTSLADLKSANVNGETLIAANDSVLKYWKDKYFYRQFKFKNEIISQAGFSDDKHNPYVILYNSGLCILDSITLEPKEIYKKDSYAYFTSVLFHSSDSLIIIGESEGDLSLISRFANTKKQIQLDDNDGFNDIHYIKALDSRKICAVGRTCVAIIDINKSIILKKIKFHSLISDAKLQGSILYISYFDGRLDLFDLNLFKISKSLQIGNSIVSIGLSKKLLFSQSFDGQILFQDINTYKKKFSISFLKGGQYLIKLFGSNYFACSKEVSKLVHYVTPSLKVISFDQLDLVYNRPDIIFDTISKYFHFSNKSILKSYFNAYVKRIKNRNLSIVFENKSYDFPSAEIINSQNLNFDTSKSEIMISLSLNDNKYYLKNYNIYVNDVPIISHKESSIESIRVKKFNTTLSLRLSKGLNKIEVCTMNEIGLENLKSPVFINYKPKDSIPERIFFLGIGVNNFKLLRPPLDWCNKDIKDLSERFNNNIYSSTKLLLDSQVTIENIKSLKSFLLNTNENDKVIMSCSSHGLLDEYNDFYLAGYNTDLNDLKSTGISFDLLLSLFEDIPSRNKLILLDACNSGLNERLGSGGLLFTSLNNNKIQNNSISEFKTMLDIFINQTNNNGITVLSGSTGTQSALEGSDVVVNGNPIKNGAFTFAILEYLDSSKKKNLQPSLNKLKSFLMERVPEITNGRQIPSIRNDNLSYDWLLSSNSKKFQ